MRDDYWEAHASEDRKTALRHNWDAISSDKLASLSPGEAFIAQYITDGPKYWYDPNYDASPLWQNMYVNMDVVNTLHGLFAEYRDPTAPPAGRKRITTTPDLLRTLPKQGAPAPHAGVRG